MEAVPRERRADNGKDGRCADPFAYDDRAQVTTRRTVPVLYLDDGGRFVIVASLAGAPRHPAWFLNLEANPRVRLQVRSRRFAATARRASVGKRRSSGRISSPCTPLMRTIKTAPRVTFLS